MAIATLTSKGQVTLPKPIRDKLGVRPGDRLEFREQDDGSVVVRGTGVDLLSLCASLKPRTRGVSVEDMKAAIRRRAARRRP